MAPREDERLLRDRTVAKLYDVSVRTVRRWRELGVLPTARTPSGQPRTPLNALRRDDPSAHPDD